MGLVLRSVCNEKSFYDWLDSAGNDLKAFRLRLKWPRALVNWRQGRTVDISEIIVSSI